MKSFQQMTDRHSKMTQEEFKEYIGGKVRTLKKKKDISS